MKRINAIIMGAAGRDFHNFNTYFRNNSTYKVVCFTAAQIPGISGRTYPRVLAGSLYPHGIKIHAESDLKNLIKKYRVDYVFFSYSDVSHADIMHKASLVLSCGANFALLGSHDTTIKSSKPVIAVCAVRTGAGKSPTTRHVALFFKKKGYRVSVLRHPMPYGDLAKEAIQRFATYEDMKNCTIEEREEYEPHIQNGIIVYAGVDYEKILRMAEKESDIIIWDGGNNDFPFIKPDLHIVLADARRPGHEMLYHPGETNFRMADVIIISKSDTNKHDVMSIENSAKKFNPEASIIKAKLKLVIENGTSVRGKHVIVVEDGPTLTHGGMKYGAGITAAKILGAKVVDASKHSSGTIKAVYKQYPHLKNVLPAMGYSKKQISDLERTINKANCDAVIEATPVNLKKLIKIKKPILEIGYEYGDNGGLDQILRKFEEKNL